MPQSTFSSREFNQHVSEAKKASLSGPVFVTDRGKPAYVLLSIDRYKKLSDKQENIIEMLAMPSDEDLEFEAPRIDKQLFNIEELE
jgi:prevent-host-death family protein